jgi:acyl-CoA thioesterase YciA
MTDPAPPTKTPPPQAPQGELSLRTLAMPADTNQNGDIFGGWLLSQMDIAGGMYVGKAGQCRSVTVAIEAMTFRKPVFVGDVVSVYVDSIRVGHTSITVPGSAAATRRTPSSSPMATSPTSRSTTRASRNRSRWRGRNPHTPVFAPHPEERREAAHLEG